MLHDVTTLQNQPSRDWAVHAIAALGNIPLLDDLAETPRYAAYGLRLLHIAAFEFPDFASSAFDLANELDNALLRAAPRICETAPEDLTKERIRVCLGAAGAMLRPPVDERGEQLLLVCYLRVRLDAQALWNEIQSRGDTIMRNAETFVAMKHAHFDGGWLH